MHRLRPLDIAPRRWLAGLGVLALSLLSCGREVTGPGGGVRLATGLSFVAQFPEPLASVAAGAGSVIPFERVRVVFRRADGSVALDTAVVFPSNADSVALSLSVQLSSSAPAEGEPLALTLAYVNATGDTVFRGGPIAVVAQVRASGSGPPPPATVPLTYTGPGAAAVGVLIAPETLTVVAGDAFAFTATALDAQLAVMAGVPLVYSSLDVTRASITAPSAGAGATTALRGNARIRVQLPTGNASDTATLIVLPRPGVLSLANGGGQTAAPGTPLPGNISVRLMATDGQPLANATVNAAVTTGGGSLNAATGTTDANGFANFTWTLGTAAGTQSITLSSAGVADVVVTANAVVANATQLRVIQQVGSTYLAGDSIPSLVVEARTAAGARDTTYGDSVFLGFAVAPAGATITGVSRLRATAGVATFNDFRLTRAGTYRMLLTAPTLNGDTSNVITVSARAASQLAVVSGIAQSALPGAALAAPVVVRTTDGYGNPVAGVQVLFSVASGSTTASADTTDANGEASTGWTLGLTAGTQVLTVTAAGLTGSPLTVNAVATSGISTTTLAPTFDTLTAIGATRLLVPTSRDAVGAVVPGTYTWVSRNTAVATVNDTGRVSSVANGETWVVATEAGGTRDSARIVVDQRLATIRVTPDPRDVYLGASFAFTAQAVDGRDVPLLSQPTFTWSTASSAIASITSAGVATGVGLGSTQVRATAGAVTGTAQLNVRTPITRIAVVRDSATFVTTDTFSIAALDRTRSYRAIAYDTLDVVMPGITFAWASSNPSVAPLDSTGSATARARAVANGFTAIRASAQGVIGAAALTVAQVMTSVELSPAAVSVAPTGQFALTARRRDANGFFIPGGSFTYNTADAGVATISASGVVTGVAVGGTTVTATSGTITSAPTNVTVTFSVPPIISFGRDTLAIGRSAVNAPIPVYLSRPDSIPVTVALAVADTFAFFNPVTVTIPTGSTVGTANLSGRNAGTTRIFATHQAANSYYAGDTAVLAVQAGVRLTTSGYTLLVSDELSTQVLLTDPAPSGGVFITYQFGTPGRVSVSPDPAFIPAGQLSANVVIRGLTAGTTTVTPLASGVIGTSSNVTTQAAILTMYRPTTRLGLGQYRNDWYVYTPSNLNVSLPVSVTSSDTTVLTTTPLATIPGGTYYSYFTVRARTTGTANVTTSATGWTPDTESMIVTTPRLDICCGATLNTTSPEQTITVYSADSTNQAHWRTSALSISVSSSDTSVLRVNTPNVVIPADQYYLTGIRVIPGGTPGTAWLRVSASGHFADSVPYTVVGPRLEIYVPTVRVGAGQNRNDAYVYTPNNVTAPLVVRLRSSDPAVATVPDSVVIPTGTYYAYFTLRGLTPGNVQVDGTAQGYQPDTVPFRVTTPKTYLQGGGTFNNFAPPATLTVYAADSANGAHYRNDSLIVAFSSSNSAVITVTAADTLAPGEYYSQGARATIVGEGTAWVRVNAPGHLPDSVLYTVVRPQISFSFSTYRIGRRQYRTPTDFYVSTPNNVTAPLAVTITQTNAPIDSLTSTALTIPNGIYYAYFGLAGLATGVDTLIASAPGYRPDTAVVIVTTPRLTGGSLPGSATTTTPPSTVTVFASDSLGTSHYVLDTILFSMTPSNSAVIQPDSAGFRIRPGQYFAQPRVRYVGPGSASMTYADSGGTGYLPVTSNTVTVTGPSLTFYNGRPVLGMRQYGAGTSAYVTIPNALASPLTVNLVSTDPAVATVPASVVIPAGQTFAYVDVRAQDQVGTVQLQATATGYASANTTQQVTAPRFTISVTTSLRTTQTPANITVFAADAAGTAHYVWEPVSVTLTSSNPGAATIDSTVVVIPAGDYYNNRARVSPVSAGTTTITASDARVASYRYGDATANVSVVTPSLAQSWGGSPLTLGIGQWAEPYVYTPDNQASPLSVALAHSTGASTSPATVTIPLGNYFVYHRITGAAVGTDEITYTAAGHNLVRGTVSVGLGTIGALGSWPTNLTTDGVSVTLYARDPAGNIRNVSAATTFDIAIAGGVFEARVGGVPVSSVTIPVDASSVTFTLHRLANGSGAATVTNANYTTQVTPSVTVSGVP